MNNRNEEKKTKTDTLEERIKNDADICVRCGLCLPHCPTYELTHDESESPRGRIAISRALAAKEIPLTNKTQLHLDHCLSCLACEAMCPVKVPYHRIIVQTRELLYPQQQHPIPKLINHLTMHTQQIPLLRRLLMLYQKTGVQWLFRKTKLLHFFKLIKYDALLRPIKITKKWRFYYPPQKETHGDVALFLGCINQLCDNEALEQAIAILTQFGYGVYIPQKQGCCGAIHLHQGDAKNAKKLREKNLEAFHDLPVKAIVSLVSGCGATLNNYQNKAFAPIYDISDFLNQTPLPDFFEKKHCNKSILIHTPCTLKNSLKKGNSLFELLTKLNFNRLSSSSNQHCCGAAGLHMWNYPEKANNLIKPLIDEIVEKKPDILVTSNIGCKLHLEQKLRKKEQKTIIMHPITLIFQEKMQKNGKNS